MLPDIPDMITGIVFPCGIHCDIGDAHVNACDVFRFDGRLFRKLNGNHEIEQFVFPDKITLPPDPFKRYFTIFSNGYRHSYPSIGSADADLIHALEAQYPLIIDYGTEIPEFMKNCFIRLIGFNNLPYDSDGKLCGKIELLLDAPVYDFLEENFVVKFLFKCCFLNKITGIVEFDEGIDQSFPLFIIWKQLYLESFKHNIDTLIQYIRLSQFLPPLKRWASLRLIGETCFANYTVPGSYWNFIYHCDLVSLSFTIYRV